MTLPTNPKPGIFGYSQVKAIIDRVGLPKTSQVIPFSSIDQCYNCIQSGTTEEGLKFSSNGPIVQMPNTEESLLGFDYQNENEDGSWVTITNQSVIWTLQ